MSEFLASNEIENETENKHTFRRLLAKFMAGDSHVHSVFSNRTTESWREADYDPKQIRHYVKNEIDKGTGKAQFVILAEHSSSTGEPEMISGEELLEHQENIHDINQTETEGPKLISGVEANVISPDGKLDVPDEVLKKMDFVMGSIHALKPIFPDKGDNPPAPNAAELTNICLGLIRNPNVDVVGHINRNIPYETIKEINWDNIFSEAVATKTAFEINLRAPMPKWLVEKAAKMGVPIFIGSDIHMLTQFQKLPENIQSQMENPDDRLRYGPGVKYWLKIARILKTLEKLNTPREQVITSSYERLNNWLAKEKSERVMSWQNET